MLLQLRLLSCRSIFSHLIAASQRFILCGNVVSRLQRHDSLGLHRRNQFRQAHQIHCRGQQADKAVYFIIAPQFHLAQ